MEVNQKKGKKEAIGEKEGKGEKEWKGEWGRRTGRERGKG